MSKTPKIRFAGFSEDWEEVNIGNVTDFHKQGYYTTEVYNPSKQYYLLRGTDLSNNAVILKDTPKINATDKDFKDFKVKIGDFLIVRSGTVGTYGIVRNELKAIFGSYLINFRFNKARINNDFFGYFYQSNNYIIQLKQIIQQSANTNINAENIKSVNLNCPSLTEQTKIGEFLKNIDNLITLNQSKYDKLVNVKTAMLEKMFPKDGEKTPQIRFDGFSDDWEELNLTQVAKYRNGKAHENNICENGKYIVINSKFVSTNSRVQKKSNQQIEPLFENEIAFVLSDVPNGKAIARTFLVKEDNLYTLNQRIAGITPLESSNSYYLHILINRNKYFLQFDDGAKQTNLSKEDVEKFSSFYPKIREQTKIGNFFKKLDNLIELEKQELEKLKNIKKSCLEKMFV